MAKRRIRLEPEAMDRLALYRAAFMLVRKCRWDWASTLQEREQYLDHLQSVLQELQLRGEQLSLLPDEGPPAA